MQVVCALDPAVVGMWLACVSGMRGCGVVQLWMEAGWMSVSAHVCKVVCVRRGSRVRERRGVGRRVVGMSVRLTRGWARALGQVWAVEDGRGARCWSGGGRLGRGRAGASGRGANRTGEGHGACGCVSGGARRRRGGWGCCVRGLEAWRMWMGGRRMRGSVGLWGCVCGVRCGEEGRSRISAGRVELCRTIACGRRAVRE